MESHSHPLTKYQITSDKNAILFLSLSIQPDCPGFRTLMCWLIVGFSQAQEPNQAAPILYLALIEDRL